MARMPTFPLRVTLAAVAVCAPHNAIAASTCYGTPASGRLEGAVKLPVNGPNFTSYSTVGTLLGRTWVHDAVREIVTDAYRELETTAAGKQYKYAESGLADGGRFWPHKTHQNGLSVDFMVPVKNASGESVLLPTNALNKFGYNIEFDNQGKYDNLTIDYEAMAAHIAALHTAAVQHGQGIIRVIFAPELQSPLFQTEYGAYLKRNVTFSSQRAWVRHDEHYHVDFKVDCKGSG